MPKKWHPTYTSGIPQIFDIIGFIKVYTEPCQTPERSNASIIFCYPSFYPIIGGVENWISQLASRLTSKCNVYMITQRIHNGWPKSEIVAGIRVFRYEAKIPHVIPSRFAYFIYALRIIGLARRVSHGANRIVLNFFDPFPQHVYAALFLRYYDVTSKIVFTLAGTPAEQASSTMKKLVSLYSNSIIGISEYSLRAFGIACPIVHICYPVGSRPQDSTRRIASWDSKQILTVCRIHPRKNLEMLIEIASRMPDLSFVVAGDNTLHHQYYKSLLQKMDIYNVHNVKFLGRVSPIMLSQLYRESTVFLLPTKHEQFGMVFSEAMSYGLPVVAPHHTAIPEAVGPGGILYQSQDLDGCMKAIQEVTNSRECWMELSQKAKAFMEQHYAQDHIGRYAQILLALSDIK